jgi:hypothetical protein
MVVFDIIVNGELTETITPVNQKLRDIQMYMHDRVYELKLKYNNNFEINRRVIY